MLKNEIPKITQIFPKKFSRKNIFIKSICLKLEKTLTGQFMKYLNDIIKLGKVIVSKKHFVTEDSLDFQLGSLRKCKDYEKINDDYYSIDVSYLKRVKSIDEKYNLLLISSKEHLDYLKENDGIIIEDILSNYLRKIKDSITTIFILVDEIIIKESFIESIIPLFSPLTKKQYQEISEKWPCFFLSRESIPLNIKIEETEIKNLYTNLIINKNECLLYDPSTKNIICCADIENGYNPINHSILKLIKKFSSIMKEEKIKFSKDGNDKNNAKLDNNELLIGAKREAPFQQLFDYNEQYYCRDLIIICLKEPCIMCAMAMIHSRIHSIYFAENNYVDGGLGGVININDFENLNHNYLVFKYEL